MNNDFEVRDKDTAIYIKSGSGEKLETLISTLDLEKVRDFIGTWLPVWSEGTKSYYVQGYGGLVNEPKRNVSLHRWIMDHPTGFVVDHIDGNTLNNRYANLRRTSQSINILNRENTGVTRYKSRWKAQFSYQERRYNLGYFDSEEEARNTLEIEKEKFINQEQFRLEYEYDLKKSVKELNLAEDFNVHHCRECGSRNAFSQYDLFDVNGIYSGSFSECEMCGAENSIATI